jgi:2,4-dienoyl-CoA reductase-like NADH-dependent reductase (Old Yellow Enzyme family)
VTAFAALLSPLRVGTKTVRNRLVSTPHVPGYDEHGLLRERHIAYLERKAAGGVGLVMAFGSANVHAPAAVAFNTPNIWDPANEEALSELAHRIHAHGALLMSQATHMGRRSSGLATGALVQAPSAIRELVHGEVPHVLRVQEIEAIVRSFADAARRLEACGFDGIEITSFGGHLIEQFLSPVANRRDDAYGGSLDRRLRFAREVVEAVAEAVSGDFLVGFRMSSGEADRIRPCIALNQDCIGRGGMGYPLRCAVNPEIGREEEFAALAAQPRPPRRRLVVVGGGPAGLEAARVAAERGHEVVLFELADRLGGQVLAGARTPDRPHLGRHVVWLAAEVERAGVDVRLGVEADADTVLAERPDAVVVATGAADVVPAGIAGVTDVALLEGTAAVPAGASVLV